MSCLLYCELVENETLDYEKILKECGYGSVPISTVINNIANLEEFYDSQTLICFYNYCLLNIKDLDILINIVKFSDLYRNSATLNILLDILTLGINTEEVQNSDNIINLKVICIKAIANYKDVSTVTTLLSCLNNKNENYKIRLTCADALGRIGDKYAVQPLINLVEDEEEKSVYIKESAAFALGLLGDMSAIDPLISILNSKQGFLDKFSFLKEKIVEALGKLNFNNKKILKALKDSLMDSSPMVRINAIEAIMNSNDENAVDIIEPCLQDDDEEVQKNALIALYNLIGRDILDKVISLPNYSENLKNEAKELMNDYEKGDYFE